MRAPDTIGPFPWERTEGHIGRPVPGHTRQRIPILADIRTELG